MPSPLRAPKQITSTRYTTTRVFTDEFDLDGRVLGSGMTGDVVLAVNKTTGIEYAVKMFRKAQMGGDALFEMRNELDVHLALDHPNIVKLEMVFESEDEVHLVMEYLSGGTVLERIEAGRHYSEAEVAEMLAQILAAIQYLHRQNILHRDLKLENLVYSSNDSNELKLIDFGLATRWNQKNTLSWACGTTDYIAPEVLKRSYGIQADMWSVGVLTYGLLQGEMPFRGNNKPETYKNILRCKPKEFPQCLAHSPLAADFINQLLVLSEKKRMSASVALQHPFVRKFSTRAAQIQGASREINTELLFKPFAIQSNQTSFQACDSCKKQDDHDLHARTRRMREVVLQCIRGSVFFGRR